MDKSELLGLAKDYSKSVDLYELLGIDSLQATDANEIKRAYRKQSIKYHPDKLGDAFDPDKWQLLERGRDVLMDKDAKAVYDNTRSAALKEHERRKALDDKKRTAIDDLEARERGELPKRQRKGEHEEMSAADRHKLYQEGTRRMEMRKREMAEAEERERRAQELVHPVGKVPEPEAATADTQPEDEDPEIAAIQRRIRDAQEKKAAKAARKAEKMARKGGEQIVPEAQEPPIPTSTKPEADAKKMVFSFTAPSAAPSTAPTAPKSDWSSIKERLKTAQAERERRKAEEVNSM